jgi:glucokinase
MDKDTAEGSRYLIVGDIGGTNCRLQLLRINGEEFEVVHSEKYST